MHDAGDGGADQDESDDGPMAVDVERGEECHCLRIVFEVEFLSGGAEEHQGEKQEGYAEKEIAEIALALAVDEDDAEEECGEDHHGEVYVVA